jgi:CxxC motif-containing protein (DUF1111 family)
MKASLALAMALALGGCVGPAGSLGTEAEKPGAGGQEALAAFDGQSNGVVDQATHLADQESFDSVEEIADGLGPLYNAQSCRECHQNPRSGGGSQVSELRAGRRDAQGRFHSPDVPIARGTVVVRDRNLINDRAICPSGAFPDQEIQERVPDDATVRTFRLSLSLFGDGLVEAVPDQVLRDIAGRQCRETQGHVCGLAVEVPVLEAQETYRPGRFGWKNQQASLLSFSADAYLNEMGITSRLLPEEVAAVCDTVADPEDKPRDDGLADIDRFARFMRSLKAPPRDQKLAATDEARRGSALFDRAGCATCHVRTLVTAPAGTRLNGGTYAVPPALGDRIFHPFGDFLLHDVGTGDGIEVSVAEHHGRAFLYMQGRMEPTAPRVRTAPLWGVRLRPRLMHDGQTLTLRDAILRHGGEGSDARRRFRCLPAAEQEQLLTFLRSL